MNSPQIDTNRSADLDNLRKLLSEAARGKGEVLYASLRHVTNRDEYLSVRQNIFEPGYSFEDAGYMVTVIADGGLGYTASTQLTTDGVSSCFHEALAWAKQSGKQAITNFGKLQYPKP